MNQWLTGYGAPTSLIELRSKEGDYYFDLENYIIYYFDGSNFVEIINLTEDNTPTKECLVTFHPQEGKFVNENTVGKIVVPAGSTINIASIPTCYLDGYSFEGYYTTPEGPLNVFSGKLTDLTPIYSDIDFYAYYVKL